MSESEQRITCRGCGEAIQTDIENCPHCGTTLRKTKTPIVAIVIGAVLILTSIAQLVVNQSFQLIAFGVVGLLLVAVGGYMLRERRDRLVEVTHDDATDPEAEV